MTASVVTTPIVPLPRDVDVQITINRPTAEIATDMSLLVFCTPNIDTLPPNNGRIIIGSTQESILQAAGWGPSDTGYWAVNAWASQSPRPARMAVGRVFTEPVAAGLMAPVMSDFTALQTITNGSFEVIIVDEDGVSKTITVTGIDFSGVQNSAGVVTAINTALAANTEYTPARLTSGVISDTTTITSIADGSFTVTVTGTGDPVVVSASGINFTEATDVPSIVTAIDNALASDGTTTAAKLTSGTFTDFTSLDDVTDGSIILTLNDGSGVPVSISLENMAFTGVTDTAGVAGVITSEITAGDHGDQITCSVVGETIVITAATIYESVSFAEAGVTGTDVSTLLHLTQAAGATVADRVIKPPSSTYVIASAVNNQVVLTAASAYTSISFAETGTGGTDISTLLHLTEEAGATKNDSSTVPLSTYVTASSLYGGRLVLNAVDPYTGISYASAADTGTNVSTILGLTQDSGGQKWDAYTPDGLVGEIRLIQQALSAASAPAFVVALDAQYRDTPQQKEVADYVEGNIWKMAGTYCTNSTTAYDSADTTNIGYYCRTNSYRTASTVYSSYPQQYPEIVYVQSLLSTNYDFESKTAKFKGEGITPENITETQNQVLNSRNINVFTRTGNNSNFFREGKQGADTWWSDSYYGWANLREEAQVAVFNGLQRRKKTPLTREGQSFVVNDLGQVFQKYVDNDFLADREDFDYTLNDPEIVHKAFNIIPSAIWNSDRETRTLAAINVIAYEAGAIHKAIIGIDAYN